jgi:glycosidase
MSFRYAIVTASPALLILSVGALASCGGGSLGTGDGGQAGGSAMADGGTGAAGGSAGGSAMCVDSLKRCSADFAFAAGNERSVEVRGDFAEDGWARGVPMTRVGNQWRASVSVPWNQPVQYKFVIDGNTWVLDPMNTATGQSGGVTNSLRAATTCPSAFTCSSPTIPSGGFDWRDSVIYSIFVDRFFDADAANNCNVGGVDALANYTGGDWKGVTSKLKENYFKDLGVNTLLITFAAENFDGIGAGLDGRNYSGYHGYWPSDVTRPERCLGTEQDLKDLVAEAHRQNIKVLLDYAMVHVHSSAMVFQQNPDWFWPLQYNGGTCICSDSGVCPWNTEGQRCWFTSYLPHWNFTVPAARAYSVNNVIDWVKRIGFDGIRADAIKHIDGSWLTELRQKLETEVHAGQNPRQRFYMVGETYDFGNRDFLKSFIDTRTKLDGQFDFPLRRILLQATVRGEEPMSNLKNFMDSNDSFYGTDAVMSTWIGNHDIGRIIHWAERPTRWGEYDNGVTCAWSGPAVVSSREPYERVAVSFGVLYTNRGAPLLYYGDEVGLPGCGDPDNRRTMPWNGLNTHQEWLKARIQRLGKIREEHPALRRGTRTTVSVGNDTWLYLMSSPGDAVYVAINRGDTSAMLNGLPMSPMNELVENVMTTGGSITVPARQVRILVAR